MPKLRYYLFVLLSLMAGPASGQEINRDDFREVDSVVLKLGSMPDSSLKSIVRDITRPCQSQACLAQAICLWVARNVDYDCDAARHPRRMHNTSSAALETHMAVCGGYAALVADMCRLAGLTCHIVPGVAKSAIGHIGNVDEDRNNHAWNAILVRDRWYLMDVTWGAGYTDADNRTFTRQLTDAWFFTDRKLFALSHFPNDRKWQFLDTPVDRSTFINAPIIGAMATNLRAIPLPGNRGLLRGRQDSTIALQFSVRHPDRIRSISVHASDSVYKAPYTLNGNILTVKVPLLFDGKYDLVLLFNSSPAFGYRAQVTVRPVRKLTPR